ncbi:MAG: hypothetical protein WBV78_17920 [Roseobacter sp.]
MVHAACKWDHQPIRSIYPLRIRQLFIKFRLVVKEIGLELFAQPIDVDIRLSGRLDLEDGFTRDVRKVGHLWTGELEVPISSDADFERAKPLSAKVISGGR